MIADSGFDQHAKTHTHTHIHIDREAYAKPASLKPNSI